MVLMREIIADVNPYQVRVALVEDTELLEVQVETRGNERLVGNIYKGKVENILPGMQAAFVDIGQDKNAFLYAGDIIEDPSEFDFPNEKPKRKEVEKIPNIKDMLKQGQEILVQVLKQPGGTKGARITTHITLPGRMMVLMPTVDHVGVSRRIVDEDERERLKEIFTRIKPEGMGVIVRTAAEGFSEEEFKTEINFLARLWERIRQKANLVSAPRLIHAEETLLFRSIRDMFTADVDRFFINDKEYFDKVKAFVDITIPELSERVYLVPEDEEIFDRYQIESKLEKAFNRKVWLKSGAYLIIEETEALTVIDVNTGKYIGEDNLQETILKTNIEAAKEIARQLRLRDIGGIVVIDFIDMEILENRQRVITELAEACKKDRTKCNVLGMTELGLIEMTRKKMRQKLSALVEKQCPYCQGSGRVYSDLTVAMKVRRAVMREVKRNDSPAYLVEVAPSVGQFILEKNAVKEALLPPYEGKVFYVKQIKSAHIHDVRVIALAQTNPKELCMHDVCTFY
ncbi:MAG: Rne/Rng family ribonuclease [Clostridiales bacterium]|nr:Rne/Rng family ribonuclease [Clostridiales bacterium]